VRECFRFARSHLALEVEGQTIIVKQTNRRRGDEQDGQMWKNCIAVADGRFNAVVPLRPEQRPALLEFVSYRYGGHSSISSALY
jgi:TPP-dependent pyruvate/acetoin dehydrogenase alpha subunit